MKIRDWFYAALWGAVDGVRAEYNRPATPGLWGFIRNDMRRYFAPLTGTVKGVIIGIKNKYEQRGPY